MTNKTQQPLSEERLREKILDSVRLACNKYESRKHDSVQAIIDATNTIHNLILQERQAWGEYVIGEDWSAGIFPSVGEPSTIEDNLRAEQRKRNNQKEKSDETINH